MADRVVAEIAHQPAEETRHVGKLRRRRGHHPCVLVFHPGEGVRHLDGICDLAVHSGLQPRTGEAVLHSRRQPDDGIASPLLAALNGLKEITAGALGKLEVGGKWCIEVGEYLAHHRNSVTARTGQTLKSVRLHDYHRICG